MKNIRKIGITFVIMNILYCLASAAIESFRESQYVFIFEYFLAASLLILLLVNFEIYYHVVLKKLSKVVIRFNELAKLSS